MKFAETEKGSLHPGPGTSASLPLKHARITRMESVEYEKQLSLPGLNRAGKGGGGTGADETVPSVRPSWLSISSLDDLIAFLIPKTYLLGSKLFLNPPETLPTSPLQSPLPRRWGHRLKRPGPHRGLVAPEPREGPMLLGFSTRDREATQKVATLLP